MLRVGRTNHIHFAAASNNLTLLAYSFDTGPDLHYSILLKIQSIVRLKETGIVSRDQMAVNLLYQVQRDRYHDQ